jgi:hypothetical protein
MSFLLNGSGMDRDLNAGETNDFRVLVTDDKRHNASGSSGLDLVSVCDNNGRLQHKELAFPRNVG